MNKYIVFAAMGVELVGVMMGCLLLGQWIDKHYETKGLAMVGLSILGLAGWLVHIVQLAKSMDKDSDKKS